MAETTTPDAVTAFLDAVESPQRREEGHATRALLERVTGAPAVMWGTSIVGFGSMPYTNTSGTTDWFVVGFSPRKAQLTLYGVYDDYAAPDPLMHQLGPHTVGKGCLYIKNLAKVELDVLEKLVRQAWDRRPGA